MSVFYFYLSLLFSLDIIAILFIVIYVDVYLTFDAIYTQAHWVWKLLKKYLIYESIFKLKLCIFKFVYTIRLCVCVHISVLHWHCNLWKLNKIDGKTPMGIVVLLFLFYLYLYWQWNPKQCQCYSKLYSIRCVFISISVLYISNSKYWNFIAFCFSFFKYWYFLLLVYTWNAFRLKK